MCASSEDRLENHVTPFGEKLQKLRKRLNVSQKDMAASLGVSAAYLSALEHGKKGTPQWALVQRIITFFNIIWDEAEELQYLAKNSDPKVQIDSSDLSANATQLANLLAVKLPQLNDAEITKLILLLNEVNQETKKP